MNFGEAIKSFWTNYVNFKGRASRSEYWFAFLFIFLAGIATAIIDYIINPNLESNETGPVSALFTIATLLPNISILVRRFHDAGFSGKIAAVLIASPLPFLVTVIVEALRLSDVRFIAEPTDEQMMQMYGPVAGWALLFLFVALACLITSFVITLLPSKNDNKWGARPVYAPQYSAPTAATVVPVETVINENIKPAPQETKEEDALEKLEKLNELKEKGLISEAEFKALKKKELGL